MWIRLALLLVLFQPPRPQDAPAPETTAPARTTQTRAERSLATLATLEDSREVKQAELSGVREALNAGVPDDRRADLLERARTLQAELDELKLDYESVATGIDVEAFDVGVAERFDLQGELQELVKPIVEELKAATEAPRQIERLRAELTYFDERERLARQAHQNIETLIAALDAGTQDAEQQGALRKGLEEARTTWERRLQNISGQREVARFQLEKRLSERSSIIDSTQAALANFFRTRGLNLILALTTFLAVVFGLRAAYRRLPRGFARRDSKERPFYARLMDVLFALFVGVAAVSAALLVLYASGDWVLLGVTLLFLLGVAWAGKTAVPMFLEQIRLLLNFGAVRERDRVVLDGIPYRVSRVSFYTLLSNAELSGGVRRLPLRDLIDMRSRICSKDEVWFPCRRGDWVVLSDGTRGCVRHQSPDTVQVETLGGALVTYPSTQFLELSPKNLSSGFRLQVRFGIDYGHQAICTTEVPEILAARVRAGLAEQFGAELQQAIKVEFLEAGASSLDYAVIADMSGEAAPHSEAIPRAIQRICVDTCNDEGWVIPFTQVTLHQAAAD